ncbi:MAG: hypothetical protein M0P32_02990, partial [Bacteroidales bacterium]|nr:hypothetical protein [Bacteroidales bacterium]
GVSTNTTIEVGDTMGQEVNIVNATLATPTLTTSSAAAQFVLGGSTASIAQYNFVATNGEVTLDKLVFSSTNSAIATITANGKTFYVINGNVTINNLGYVIPAGYAGKTLPISVTYNNVGKSGDAAVTSNTASTLTLTGFEYLAGNTRTIITGITVAANTLNVVNAIPSVSLTSASRAGLINGLVKLADVTISASSNGGAIKINDLPITVTSTGVATASGIVVKDASGTTIVTSDDTLGVSAGTSDDVVIFFTNGYSILPGESKTFSLYTTAVSVSGSVNTTALGTALGSKTLFAFTDVNSDTKITDGTPTFNYTTGVTSTIHN